MGARLLMQAALEAEVTEFLGRDRYQRAAACQGARPGSRTNWSAGTGSPSSRAVAMPTYAALSQTTREIGRGSSCSQPLFAKRPS